MKNEWFKDWFNTSYYHILYKNRNDEEAENFINNLISFIKLPKKSAVLDLACGKGRHSITLNKLGMDVLGADLASESIQSAKKWETEGLQFMVHDMREPILNHQFNAVFNLFTSFGYFDNQAENLKVINAVHSYVEPNGLFIIDFMNCKKVIANLVNEEQKNVDGINFNIKRNSDANHIFKYISFTDKGTDYEFTERVQAITNNDFLKLFENKFEVLHTFGDFDLNPFDENNSDRLIYITKKI
jgi:SAM-dependent methyltransferase